MAAVRLGFVWFGVRKSLTQAQKCQAADPFGAEESFLSAGKKLLDTRDAAYRQVTAVRTRIVSYWKSLTLPYPEPGIRLIKQGDLEAFNRQMLSLQRELDEAVAELGSHYGELKQSARERLGTLFNPADYPPSLTGLFAMSWDFPSVEPPEYLRRLNPKLFEEESKRVSARFDEAIHLAEQAFIEELSNLVGHLTERLSGGEDGQAKVFRDSAVENLTEFFERFRRLNVRSCDELDDLVSQAQRVVRNVQPQQLRDSATLRQQVASQLSGITSVLDGLLVDRPRRRLLRNPK
jgi:hypothetical protein